MLHLEPPSYGSANKSEIACVDSFVSALNAELERKNHGGKVSLLDIDDDEHNLYCDGKFVMYKFNDGSNVSMFGNKLVDVVSASKDKTISSEMVGKFTKMLTTDEAKE